MRVLWVQLGKEFRELVESHRLLVMLAAMAFFGILSPVTAYFMPDLIRQLGDAENIQILMGEPSLVDALDQFVRNSTQMVMLLVVLLSFGAIVSERERGLMMLMFPHPLPREVMVLAKFVSLAGLLALGLSLGGLLTYLYSWILFSRIGTGGFLALLSLLFLYLLTFMATSLLASTLGRTTGAAAGLAFGFVALILLSSLTTGPAPSQLLEWGTALAVGAETPARWGSLLASLALTAFSVLLACWALRRQEI